jgi:hypothetical protein
MTRPTQHGWFDFATLKITFRERPAFFNRVYSCRIAHA